MQYRGDVRTTELPLAQDMIGQLAFEAAFRNVTIGELIGELIVAVVNKDLLGSRPTAASPYPASWPAEGPSSSRLAKKPHVGAASIDQLHAVSSYTAPENGSF
jgi:hypothetical protein